MSIFLLSIFVTLMITAIAAYFDIKKGIIPNKLTISLLLFGISINLIFSILNNNSSYIFNSIILALFTFLLTYILWKFKIWAGGDVKLFTAIATCIPIQPNLLEFQFFNLYFPKIAVYPFPLTVIFNSILISFPFLILFLLLENYKITFNQNIFNFKRGSCKISFNQNIFNFKRSSCKISFNQNIFNFKQKILEFKESIKSFNILKQINSNRRIIFKKSSYSLIFSSLFIVLTGIYKNSYYSIYILLFGPIFSLISSFLFKSIIKIFKKFLKNSSCKKIAISNLDEGMIIDKTYFNVDKLYSNNFDELINSIDINESNLDIKEIATEEGELTQYFLNSSTAAGLTIYDVLFLKKLFKMNFINESIQIKVGIPFAPSIAIGLIISIFIGDLCILLVNIFNSILV